jgi:hypothetical protein
VFRELAPGTFANSEASSLFRDGGGLRNYALFATSEPFLKSAMALEHSLDTGQAAHDHALGQKVWEYLRDHPEDEAFNRGLAEIRTDERAAIAAAYGWAGVKSVVDVGAGAGALLASIVAGNPGVRGVLFDRPDVLPDAGHLLKTRGVRERCELMAMMMFGGEARQRTGAEYNQLFSATGFGPACVIRTGTAFRILEAKPR